MKRIPRHSNPENVMRRLAERRPSKLKTKPATAVAPMMVTLVIGVVLSLIIPRTTSAQTGGPTVIIKDIPRKIENFVTTQRNTIKDKIKIAGDVAYKTGLRVFYQQLAQLTFQFVSTAGTGQSPLFITKPTYFADVYQAAQNDYLDHLAKDFGVQYAAQDSDTQKTIALLARGILNPNTACEQACSQENATSQGILKLLEIDSKKYTEIAKQDKTTEVTCPFIYDQGTDTYDYDGVSTIQSVNPEVCATELNNLLATKKRQASTGLQQCIQACAAGKQTTLANNQVLNNAVTNEQVALAISEAFRPQQSQLGTLLSILSDAQTKGVAVTAAERDIAQNNDVKSIRTLSGEVKAPGSIAQQYTNAGIDNATGDVGTLTGSRIADVIGRAAGDALIARIGKALLNNCGLNPKACKNPTGTSAQSRILFGSNTTAAALQTFQLGKPEIVSGDPSKNPVLTTSTLQANGIIDQRFALAVDQRLTVKQALEQGFIDGDRTFGFRNNGEQPSDGYPYRMIVYLRQARIVPVGWELAAQYISLPDSRRETSLTELVDKYSVCGQDAEHDEDGNPSNGFQSSPFCGLVDPDWVLKAPLTYCRKQGAGEQIFTKTFVCDQDTNVNGRIDCSPTATNPQGGDIGRYEIQRNPETCVDEPTCVVENEDGSCKSYGYCFEDRRTFRFNGQQCPNYYASCTSYTDSVGAQVAYLSKTTEVNGCSSENAGCEAYCGDRKQSGSFLCSNTGASVACAAGETCTCRLPGGESCSIPDSSDPTRRTCKTNSGLTCTLGTNITYFDRDAQTCDSSAEGCRQFISTAGASNILANGSFESHEAGSCGSGENVKGWGCHQISADTSGVGDNNTTSVVIPSGGPELIFTNDRIPPGLDLGRPLARATLTLSYYAKADSSCSANFGLRTPDASVDMDPASGAQATVTKTANYTSSWQRYSGTFFIPDGTYDNAADKHRVQPVFQAGSGCSISIDNVQLESTDGPSSYQEYGTVNVSYLNKSRQVCNPVDVGCNTYQPTAGGDAINGVVNWPDVCAPENAGCRAYRKEAITHLPSRAAVDPINLTASSGRTCSAAEVGCEEYTNLDVAAQGGEAKEYYTQIQQCVKPVDGTASQQTYFTWVGSNESGFQLKSFRMKASNIPPPPVSGESGIAPCTNLKLGTSLDDNNPACEDTPATIAKCSASDIGTNPDCSQYFDGNGNVFYRLRSRVIPVSDQCRPYRNTIDQRDGSDKVYLVLANQSASCRAEAAECRAFTGNAGTNASVVFSDNFEGSSSVTNAWIGSGTPNPGCSPTSESICLSPESVNAGGRSMDANGSFSSKSTVLENKVRKGATYTLSFWAKPVNATKLEQAFIQVGSTPYYLAGSSRPQLDLASEWHPYTVGPVTLDVDPGNQTVQLGLRFTNGGSNGQAFIDNIVFNEIRDSVFLVDGTYHTCPNSELGCESYTDRLNQKVSFKSVTRLCAQEAVACTAFIDTQNSTDPFASLPIRGVTVPADTTASYIDASTSHCSADAKGCTAFGIPVRDVNQRIASFETVYLKDDPETHAQTLCSINELSCSEYTTSEGTKAYFKDPKTQTCEFKKLSGDRDYQWYVTGTSFRCPVTTPPSEGVPTGRACTLACSSGLRVGQSCVLDADCPASNGTCTGGFCQGGAKHGNSCSKTTDCASPAGACIGDSAVVGKSCSSAADCGGGNICGAWAGICPAEQNGCNEYRDPSDPAQCRSSCSLELSSTSGKPIPVDESCQPTICESGPKAGAYCGSNADCPGKCTTGSRINQYCTSGSDCGPGGTCGGAAATNPGACSGEGIPGCRAYTYLRQSVESGASECNGRVDVTNGCRPFNDTSNPALNFRAF